MHKQPPKNCKNNAFIKKEIKETQEQIQKHRSFYLIMHKIDDFHEP
jgi:hypothetical protein